MVCAYVVVTRMELRRVLRGELRFICISIKNLSCKVKQSEGSKGRGLVAFDLRSLTVWTGSVTRDTRWRLRVNLFLA